MKKEHNRIRLAICLFALCVLTAGAVLGKYVSNQKGEYSVTFTAKLAQELIVQEHIPEQQEDGSYDLSAVATTEAQSYHLIPGLDIPKDTHVVIKGKTDIPAYLFVEIVETLPNAALGYEKADIWKETDLLDAMPTLTHGGQVYVYCGDTDAPVEIASTGTGDIVYHILKDDEITVGQELLHGTENNSLVFHAYLIQTTAFTTAG